MSTPAAGVRRAGRRHGPGRAQRGRVARLRGRVARLRGLAAALAAAALAAGCGYRTGLVPPELGQTVAVEFFGNGSKVRDLEVELQAALTDALNRMVHAPLVAPETADYVIRGQIDGYSRRRGIRSPDNVVLETGVEVLVQARLIRRRFLAEGELAEELVEEGRYASSSGYRLEEPLGEDEARERVLRNIADRIVMDLFGSLSYEFGP